MGYQALYRRYRPARFSDFVGQEAIIKTLRSQVMSGRIAHAYLFCGTRGTGKTSAAKVFARAVNCEHPIDGDPCGTCAACVALSREANMDILEIDAASNNGVDEIRDLREKVKYPPQIGRYRVYIIDEVHMLSTGAFNALLKTLEEPPSFVVFILATTEPRKLLPTILSRCQRFDFGRIPAAQITARLKAAMAENGLPAEDAALRRVARAAEGGMRDAWSILDMCMSYAQETGGLTEALVTRVLGASDNRFLFDFADKLISGDASGALSRIDDAMRDGREVQVLCGDVSAHLRALMLAGVCGAESAEDLLEVTAEDAADYAAQAGRVSHERLLRMLDLFIKAQGDMKWTSQPRFALEQAALRACVPEEGVQNEALAVRVGELERRLGEGGSVPPDLQRRLDALEERVRNAPVRSQGNAEKPAGASETESARVENAPVQETPQGPAPDMERIWQAACAAAKKDPMLFGSLRQGRLASADNGVFTVVFDRRSGGVHVKLLSRDEVKEKVGGLLTQAAGYPCTFIAAIEGTVHETGKAYLDAKQEAEQKAAENLSKITDFFGRENVRILNDGQ